MEHYTPTRVAFPDLIAMDGRARRWVAWCHYMWRLTGDRKYHLMCYDAVYLATGWSSPHYDG